MITASRLLAQSDRILRNIPFTRAKKKPFVWSVDEEGYKKLEQAIIDILLDGHNKWSEGILADIEAWIDVGLSGIPTQTEIDTQINNWVNMMIDRMVGDTKTLTELGDTLIEAPLFGAFEVGRDLKVPYPRTSSWDVNIGNWLKKDSKFWLNDVYNYKVRKNLTDTTEALLSQGLGRRELGQSLKLQFSKVVEKTPYQWEVVGSSMASRGRHFGQISTYEEYEVETWSWSASGDERVCDVCGRLDRTVFEVASAVQTMNDFIAMEPDRDNKEDFRDAVKERTPWVSWDKKKIWTDSQGIIRKGSAFYQLPSTGKTKHYLGEGLVDSSKLQKIGIGQAGQIHGG